MRDNKISRLEKKNNCKWLVLAISLMSLTMSSVTSYAQSNYFLEINGVLPSDSGSSGASSTSLSSSCDSLSSAVSPYYRYVTASALNIRSGPSTSYSQIGVLKYGEDVKVIGEAGSWRRIAQHSSCAFVHGDYLSGPQTATSHFLEVNDALPSDSGYPENYNPDADLNVSDYHATVTASALNVRRGPGTEHGIHQSLPYGSTVKVTHHQGIWLRIEWSGGALAYVHGNYLKRKDIFEGVADPEGLLGLGHSPILPDTTPEATADNNNLGAGRNCTGMFNPARSMLVPLQQSIEELIGETIKGDSTNNNCPSESAIINVALAIAANPMDAAGSGRRANDQIQYESDCYDVIVSLVRSGAKLNSEQSAQIERGINLCRTNVRINDAFPVSAYLEFAKAWGPGGACLEAELENDWTVGNAAWCIFDIATSAAPGTSAGDNVIRRGAKNVTGAGGAAAVSNELVKFIPRASYRLRIGHTLPWQKMTTQQRKAFQHSYSRHALELGLPTWKQSNAEVLRLRFNNTVGYIRNNGEYLGVRKKPFNGVSTDVHYYEANLHGIKYYYYETLDGEFISAGKAR